MGSPPEPLRAKLEQLNARDADYTTYQLGAQSAVTKTIVRLTAKIPHRLGDLCLDVFYQETRKDGAILVRGMSFHIGKNPTGDADSGDAVLRFDANVPKADFPHIHFNGEDHIAFQRVELVAARLPPGFPANFTDMTPSHFLDLLLVDKERGEFPIRVKPKVVK